MNLKVVSGNLRNALGYFQKTFFNNQMIQANSLPYQQNINTCYQINCYAFMLTTLKVPDLIKV